MAHLTLPGHNLTSADQHYIALDLKMVIGIARTLPETAARDFLRRWEGLGPHKSGRVVLTKDAIDAILAEGPFKPEVIEMARNPHEG